jgi:hypothetical protein
MQRLGVTIGAISLGADTAIGHQESRHDEKDFDVSVSELTGQARQRLVWEATLSEEFAYTAETLGEVPDVEAAAEYRITGPDIDVEGYSVIFGDPETGSPTIKYYRSTAGDFDVKVHGGRSTESGIKAADGSEKTTIDIGTQDAKHTARHNLERELSTLPIAASNPTPVYDDAVLFSSPDADEQSLNAPIQENGEIVDVVEIEIPADEPVAPTEHIVARSQEVEPLGHEHCDPTGNICTDFCALLCSALAGLAGAACTAKCAGTIAGIPISPACGAVCAGVVGGVCYPTCTNQTGQ